MDSYKFLKTAEELQEISQLANTKLTEFICIVAQKAELAAQSGKRFAEAQSNSRWVIDSACEIIKAKRLKVDRVTKIADTGFLLKFSW